jgi:hypothetical protein
MRIFVLFFGLLFLLLGLAIENSIIEDLSIEVARLKVERSKEEMEFANLAKQVAQLGTMSNLLRTAYKKGGSGIDMATSDSKALLTPLCIPPSPEAGLVTDNERGREVAKAGQ